MLSRAIGLVLILPLASGCVPVAVGTAAALWYGLEGRASCGVIKEKPDFEEKMKNPEYREYYENMCGKQDEPKQ